MAALAYILWAQEVNQVRQEHLLSLLSLQTGRTPPRAKQGSVFVTLAMTEKRKSFGTTVEGLLYPIFIEE
jgi:hypothetical protein